MIPLGLLVALYFAFVCSYSLIYGDLWGGDGLNVIIIRLLLVVSALFFLYVIIGGIRLLLQLKCVVQFASIGDFLKIRPFLGSTAVAELVDIRSIDRVGRDRSWVMITLLSRQGENYRIELRNGGYFFLNGEVPGVHQFVREARAFMNY